MTELVVEPTNGRDAEEFAPVLRRMYAGWSGEVDGEQGLHRLVFRSPTAAFIDNEHGR